MSRFALVGSFVVAAILAPGAMAPSAAAAEPGAWSWPVAGPVIRAFDPPDSPYGSGHRGIDIATGVGTTVTAPTAGVVTFAGSVGGHLFVTIDHGRGWESTYSWLSARLVSQGDAVAEGAAIARTGSGHPGSDVPHLHFGVKLDDEYVDPLTVLAPLGLVGIIRLAPLREVA